MNGAGYLRRDEDDDMGLVALRVRQISYIVSDLTKSRRWSMRSRWTLARLMLRYHHRMIAGLPGDASRQHRITIARRGGGKRCLVLRDSTSDLAVLREVFVLDSYGAALDAAHAGGNLEPLIVDIGANIGLASCFFALGFPDADIVCVEPIHENVAVLEANASSTGRNWTVHQAAVSDRPGQLVIHPFEWWLSGTVREDIALARKSRQSRPESRTSMSTRTVDALTMSEIAQKTGDRRISLLKLDIEGEEEAVLTDPRAHEWLCKVDVLVVDIHDKYVSRVNIEKSIEAVGLKAARTGARESVFVRGS